MRKIALIGAGRIAGNLLASLTDSDRREWQPVIALARHAGPRDGFPCPVTDSLDALLETQPDLIIETAGPAALAQYGEALLAASDVWSVSAAALADRELHDRLEATGKRSGRILRLVSGAIGGLDVLAAMATDPQSRFHFSAGVAGRKWPEPWPFSGTVREATQSFHGINVLAAAALAASGLDDVTVDHETVPAGLSRHFELEASGPLGHYTIIAKPGSDPLRGTSIVAASILAALRREASVIQTS